MENMFKTLIAILFFTTSFSVVEAVAHTKKVEASSQDYLKTRVLSSEEMTLVDEYGNIKNNQEKNTVNKNNAFSSWRKIILSYKQ